MEFVLGPKALAAGYRCEGYGTIDSTNAMALSRARAQDAGRLWIVSAHQSAGRGRRGNHWRTPPGNLAASLLTVIDSAANIAATLSFVAGLAVDEALRRIAPELSVAFASDGIGYGDSGRRDRLRLKWPNDVLLDGGKLAGILLEAEPIGDGRLAVVIGIGVNIVESPDDLAYPTAALASVGISADAADIFWALSESWIGIERMWDGGKGFAGIRKLWLERAAGVGEEVTVRIGGEVLHGAFETIDDEGRLVIRAPTGATRVISAGEVHFGGVEGSRP